MMKHGEHHQPGPHEHHDHGREHSHRPGAQTFRRGRALDFLQRLEVKRATLVQQLQQPALASIHPMLAGELKAIELVMNEFIDLFELHQARLPDDDVPIEPREQAEADPTPSEEPPGNRGPRDE